MNFFFKPVNWHFWLVSGKRPAPWVQDWNDLIHKEPYATVAHGAIWSCILLFGAPLCGFGVLLWTGLRLMLWAVGYSTKTVNTSTSSKELAVVITGCDSGFGKELALVCAENGFHVFAGCLQKDSLKMFDGQKNLQAFVMDVCLDDDVKALSKAVFEWIGQSETRFLHAVVNNAGVGLGGLVDWIDMEAFSKSMEVNCIAQIRVTKAFLFFLKTQYASKGYEDARIVNMVSMAGLIHGLGMSPYSTSKFAAEGFSNALRLELKDFCIKVVTLNPSFHETPLTADLLGPAKKSFDNAPADMKAKYGEAYVERNFLFYKLAESCMWRAENVVQDMFRAISLVNPPPRFVSGGDAKFGLLVQRMLPDALSDLLLPRFLHPPAFFSNDKSETVKEKQT